MDQDAGMRDLMERIRVRELIERYLSALDRLDFAALEQVFTEDADIRHHVKPEDLESGVASRGGAQWVEGVRRMARFASTNHTLSNAVIVVDGERARADARACAYLLDATTRPGTVHIRLVRYMDEFMLQHGEWRICKRRHIPLIQYSVPAAEIRMPYD